MIELHETESAVRFAVRSGVTARPAPALFVFATTADISLQEQGYREICDLLQPHGVLCVSLDLPCHGTDQKPGEPAGLQGWAVRIANEEPIISQFTNRASAVLNHLIQQGIVDPARVAACGTSRGGFMALHFAAAEPHVKAVAAFSPVTNLLALSEFNGMETSEFVQSLSLESQVERLAGRSLYISIGNADERVDTDAAVALARRVVRHPQNTGTVADVELHVVPASGHSTPASAHGDAARWMGFRLGLGS